jgi:hypothetical protein
MVSRLQEVDTFPSASSDEYIRLDIFLSAPRINFFIASSTKLAHTALLSASYFLASSPLLRFVPGFIKPLGDRSTQLSICMSQL